MRLPTSKFSFPNVTPSSPPLKSFPNRSPPKIPSPAEVLSVPGQYSQGAPERNNHLQEKRIGTKFPREKWMFPKIVVPPNHPFVHRVFPYKPSISGYTYFWKHPNRRFYEWTKSMQWHHPAFENEFLPLIPPVTPKHVYFKSLTRSISGGEEAPLAPFGEGVGFQPAVFVDNRM